MVPSGECLRGKSPPDRMLAIPWRRLFLAACGLNLVVVAVLRGSVNTSYIVAVLRARCHAHDDVVAFLPLPMNVVRDKTVMTLVSTAPFMAGLNG